MKRRIINSILTQYIISYAIIMSVLLVCVGAYMDNSFTTAVRAEIENANLNRVSGLRVRHEEKLAMLLSLGTQLGFSDYIAPFKLAEEPMKAFYLVKILSAYAAANDFCDQFYVIFNIDDYLYSSSTSVSLQMYTERLMEYEGVSPEALRELLRRDDNSMSILPAQPTRSPLQGGASDATVSYIVPLRLAGRFHAGNIMFLISDAKYRRLFEDRTPDEHGAYVFFDGGVLAGHGTIPGDIAAEAAYAATEPVSELDIDGTKYLMFTECGDMLGMRYATFVPLDAVRTRTMRTRLGLGLFLLLLSLPCGLLTVYFSRRHAKPIRELKRSIGASMPEADDFAAIRDGIEALVDKNQDLSSRLSESLPARSAEFAKKFIKNRYASRADAVEAALKLGLDIDRGFFLVSLTDAALSADELGGIVTGAGRMESVGGVSGLAVTGCGVEIVSQDLYLSCMFADSGEALESWAIAVKNAFSVRDADAVVAVSGVHGDFAKAGTAYLEANAAYDNRFVMGGEHVLRFADVSVGASDIEPYIRSYTEGFHKALHAGDSRAVNDRISELAQVLEAKKFSLFGFRVIYNDIMRTLLSKYYNNRGAAAHSSPLNDVSQYYDIFSLSSCRRVSDLTDIMRGLCDDILAREENPSPDGDMSRSQGVIRRITAYMRENFADPALNMSAVAEKYGISPVRLSVDYKELTGMYPSDFLFLLRMERAKELLEQTDMTVKDISAAVGYYDASGFIRRFKKHMLVTPAQYRQRGNRSEARLAPEAKE